ncbi:three-Cys-motif partner protein TcmP [Accumulibacter sp.]|uniref:three-Cys-motif partner protein TcmP n=1 Tax=Accumulibacter sp. TaxID=2053492 RepID=UPI0028C384DA|nr:three-Cys-motif partner protein TcmP [Accumulibacter sp.]
MFDIEKAMETDEEKAAADEHAFGGSWTLIKLDALEKYLSAFNTALSRQGFTRIYIDGFAGTGRCDISVKGEKSSVDGSVRRALRASPPFHKLCFIELEAQKIAALRALQSEHHDKRIEVIRDDANATLKYICRTYDWKNTRAVLFLDPCGMHVEWSTLEAIAATGAVDVWYLFPYYGLYRQAANKADALDANKKKSLTRILGTDAWRQEFYAPQRQSDLFGKEGGDVRESNHRDMLEFVSARLSGIFPAVAKPKILYQAGDSKRPGGAPLFALYFAAANPKRSAHGLAIKIATEVLNSL